MSVSFWNLQATSTIQNDIYTTNPRRRHYRAGDGDKETKQMRLTPEQRAERDALVFAQKESGSSYDEIYIDGVKLAKSSASAAYWRHVAMLRIGKGTDAIAPEFVKVDPAQVNPAYQPIRDAISETLEAAQWANETVNNLEERSINLAPVIGMGAYAATGDSEAVIRIEASQAAPEALQFGPKKGDGFGKFVTVSLILVGATIAGITAFHFTAFGELGMSWGFSVVLSLALEAGFWASMVQVSHKDTEHYWTFEVLSGALIVYRLLANTSGIFAHAHDHHARLFSVELHGWQVWAYAILLASLLTLFDVVIARITVERLINQSK